MVKIIVSEDCGNSPKKLHLKEFSIAVVKDDTTFLNQNMSDDICWDIVGDQQIQGKANVIAALEKMRSAKLTELVINTIVTHGYNGAADGLLKLKDGKVLAFCDMFTFNSPTNNAKIKEITSYVVEVKN